MSRRNPTNTSRAARRLARLTNLTYTQALARLRAAGTVPDLDDAAAVTAFLAATATPSDSATPQAPDANSVPTTVDCENCACPVVSDRQTATGWTHVEVGGKSGGFWCNPEFTAGNAHTAAEPQGMVVCGGCEAEFDTRADFDAHTCPAEDALDPNDWICPGCGRRVPDSDVRGHTQACEDYPGPWS